MKKDKALILYIFIPVIFLFFAFSALALNEGAYSADNQPESIEELCSKIESYLPNISRERAAALAEAIYLMNELQREISLTNELIEIREEGGPEEAKEQLQKAIEGLQEAIEELAPEELKVAKHISEKPEKSLPREEKSLIKELEEKGAAEEVKPASRRESEVYQKEELEKDSIDVVIEKEQVVLVPTLGLKRFMVTDPDVLKVAKIDDKISASGTNYGRAFLHIWDSEGRRTIKFTVKPKGFARFKDIEKRLIEAKKMDSFKVKYSFDRYRTNSKSLNPDRSYHHTWWAHRLGINGETPWGRTDSRFQYEGREEGGGTENERDLTAWDFNLRGEDLEVSLGETYAYFSDITLPGTGYQGIRFRNPDKEDINYDFVWGVRGSRMWGYKLGQWTNENYFCGTRVQIEPADFIHFNTTYMRALEDQMNTGEYVYAAGTGLNFFKDAVKIESEFARGKSQETDVHQHAYKIDTIVNLKDFNLLLKGTYRDIETNFLPVTGSRIPYEGELGYYFNADYNPLPYLRLTGEYNKYRSRIDFNPTDTQTYNYDWRGTFDFNIGPDTRFSYADWSRMSEGHSAPSHQRGKSYNLVHSLSLPSPMRFLSLYLQYIPSTFRSLTSPSSDYRSRRIACGMRLNVIKNLYYDLTQTWDHHHMVESGEFGTLKTLSTGLLYSSQILDTPFYGSLNVKYHKERDVMENLPLSSGDDVISTGGEIRYRPSSDFSTYLRLDCQRIHGVLDHGHNRQEMRIYGGGDCTFDTTLRFGIGGSVKGFVFKDTDGNGRKDPGEEGLSGINVYAGKLHSTETSTNGEFEFKRLKDYEVPVMYDAKLIPEGYKPTTANPQIVKLERGVVSEVNFGIMAVAEIFGQVFNDVNMNGIFDEGDQDIRGVLITLDDGNITQTSARGYYRMEDVKPGKKTLTLDTVTLPFNLVPLTETKKVLEIKEGESYEEIFPLYALRTIVGTVFVDANKNNNFDAGEKGVADVILRCAGSTAITDNEGRFFLKKLPGGKQEILLDSESIPPEYKIAVEPSRSVELEVIGEIKEDVNFPLRKR